MPRNCTASGFWETELRLHDHQSLWGAFTFPASFTRQVYLCVSRGANPVKLSEMCPPFPGHA